MTLKKKLDHAEILRSLFEIRIPFIQTQTKRVTQRRLPKGQFIDLFNFNTEIDSFTSFFKN